MAALGNVNAGVWPTPDGWATREGMVYSSGVVDEYKINRGLKYGPVASADWPTPDGWASREGMIYSGEVDNYIIRMLQLVFRLLWPHKGQRWPLGRVEL